MLHSKLIGYPATLLDAHSEANKNLKFDEKNRDCFLISFQNHLKKISDHDKPSLQPSCILLYLSFSNDINLRQSLGFQNRMLLRVRIDRFVSTKCFADHTPTKVAGMNPTMVSGITTTLILCLIFDGAANAGLAAEGLEEAIVGLYRTTSSNGATLTH